MATMIEKSPTRWLTVDEVATELRVSPRVVLSAIHRGTLRAARLGKEYRVPTSALGDALLNTPAGQQ